MSDTRIGDQLPDRPSSCDGCERYYWPYPWDDGGLCGVCRLAEGPGDGDLDDEPPPASLPTRPSEIEWTPLRELADRYLEHAGRLVDHRAGVGGLLPGELMSHALAALSIQHRLAEEALAGRWVNAVAALEHGATGEQVAKAMGLDAEEVVVGLSRWAAGQVRAGHLTPAGRDDVLALLDWTAYLPEER